MIVGGESGADARPMAPEWARIVRDDRAVSGVPFFFKEWGGRTPKAGGHELDGTTWDGFPSPVSCPSATESLRQRPFPTQAAC